MRLSRFLRPELIEPDLAPTEKEAALDSLVRLALSCPSVECTSEAASVLSALQEREAVTSTGIGNGVAIPHAKVEGLKKMVLVLARSKSGVSFQALDEAPVHLIFMVIAPPEAVSDYLRLLAAISAFVKSERNRNALLSAQTREEMLQAVKAAEKAQA
ncbi:MAG: PTS sugar transporter subunit IIA [candidate division WOR-3 bacterium]